MFARDRDIPTWRTGAVLMTALVLATLGCDSLLDVNDPDVVTPSQLEGPSGVPAKMNGIINDFREVQDTYVNYSGLLTDEFILAGTFPTRLEIDDRRPRPNNGTLNGDVVEPLQQAIQNALKRDSSFSANLGKEEFSDVQDEMEMGIALARLYGGYERIYLAEFFCHSILAGESGPRLPDARMQNAYEVLETAKSAGEAAGLTGGETDVVTAATIGQARTLLFRGQYQEAADLVEDVPTTFMYFIDYSANKSAEQNEVFGRNWGSDAFNVRWTVGNGANDSRGNERFAYYDEWVASDLLIPPEEHNVAPFQTGIVVSLENIYQDKRSPIPLATGWEARMIEAEALLRNGQPGAAEDMVNNLLDSPELNPIGNPELRPAFDPDYAPVDFTDDGGFVPSDDLPELARARLAGLWLQGQRQGTLRRLYRNDGIDLYPDRGGESMSVPMTQQEVQNNDNLDSACPGGRIPGRG